MTYWIAINVCSESKDHLHNIFYDMLVILDKCISWIVNWNINYVVEITVIEKCKYIEV